MQRYGYYYIEQLFSILKPIFFYLVFILAQINAKIPHYENNIHKNNRWRITISKDS